MRERLQSPYPLLFVQYHLQGGSRRFGMMAAAYTLICLLGLLGYRRAAMYLPLQSILGNALKALAFAQGVILVLVGSNMVHRALSRDHQTRMTESHRLSPMSNTSVVLGYLLGGPLQALLLFSLNLVLGTVLAAIAQVPFASWFGGNALLMSTAVTLWALTVFFGVGQGKPISPVGPVVGLMFMVQPLSMFLPGAALLLGVYSGFVAIYVMLGASSPGLHALLLMGAGNTVFALFWLNAACARYRRPELPAINGLRGTVLLLLWLAISMLGTIGYQAVSKIKGYSMLEEGGSAKVHWLISLCVALPLSLLPLRGAVTLTRLRTRGMKLRDWSDRLPETALVFGLPVLLCLTAFAMGGPIWRPIVRQEMGAGTFNGLAFEAWSRTAIVCFLASVTAMALMRLGGGRAKSSRSMAISALALLWLLPLAFDAARVAYETAQRKDEATLSALFGCSPIGTLILTWSGQRELVGTGLFFQAGVAGAALAAAHLALRRPKP